MNNKFLLAAAAGVLSFGIATAHAEEAKTDAVKSDTEKCYGAAAAGQNSCKGNNHSCAGQSKVDNDPAEFKAVAVGTCKDIKGGSLTAPEAKKS